MFCSLGSQEGSEMQFLDTVLKGDKQNDQIFNFGSAFYNFRSEVILNFLIRLQKANLPKHGHAEASCAENCDKKL